MLPRQATALTISPIQRVNVHRRYALPWHPLPMFCPMISPMSLVFPCAHLCQSEQIINLDSGTTSPIDLLFFCKWKVLQYLQNATYVVKIPTGTSTSSKMTSSDISYTPMDYIGNRLQCETRMNDRRTMYRL